MERVITKPIGRNFEVGQIYDLPMMTWRHIERNCRKKLDRFSKPVDDAVRDAYREKRK